MSYRQILVHLDLARDCGPACRFAAALASAHEAQLRGLALAIAPIIPTSGLAPLPVEILDSQRDAVLAAAQEAAGTLEAAARTAGVPCEVAIIEGVSGLAYETAVFHARHADLTIMTQPEEGGGPFGDEAAAFEELLFGSGRPVLMVPHIGAPAAVPKHPLVLWDGGREATRAIADAMPLLQMADRTTVLIVNPESRREQHGEEPGADIAAWLTRHGPRVEVVSTQTGGIDTGSFVLSQVSDRGADLMVMGGYGHSRMRQFVAGGVTKTMLQSMTVPVLFSH